MSYRKKLIEVGLPIEDINREAMREKSIRHGHPSTLHLWWARRPIGVVRIVLFASIVDDPSAHPDKFPTKREQAVERNRLHDIIRRICVWDAPEHHLEEAREEIRRQCGDDLPPVLDPFCGGGTTPLEAQRLGLPAYGGDLNPVSVLISKAMVEIPPRFAGRPPVNPEYWAEVARQAAEPEQLALL